MADFSKVLAAQLVEAAQAAMIQPAAAPRGWTLITTFDSDGSASPPQPGGQGMYLTGIDRSTGDTISVLALGVPWKSLISDFVPISPKNPQRQQTALGDLKQVDGSLVAVPEAIVGSEGAGSEFTSLHLAIYSQLWAPLWNQLDAFRSSIDANQLYVVGLGPGAPLALLAALDLRSGHRGGPNRVEPPARQPRAYTFSSAPVANQALQTFYATEAGDTFSINAGASVLPVDFYPSAPDASDGFVLPGSVLPIAAKLTAVPDPWAERSARAYERALDALDSEQPSGLGTGATVGAAPSGYDQASAYTLARLCAVANGQRQHPVAAGEMPLGTYSLAHRMGGEVVWGSVFDHVSGPTVAFRDTVSWQELIEQQMPNAQKVASFLGAGTGQVQTTLLTVYETLRDALFEMLGDIVRGAADGRPVTFTGYGFGGALASLAALDLLANHGSLTLGALYTFGASRPGDLDFANHFADVVGGKSFQIARPADVLPTAMPFQLYEPLTQQVPLLGTPQDDDPATYHTLASYLELLDPYA